MVYGVELLPHLAQVNSIWERIHKALRERVRVKQGREPTPSAAIIDSQSGKTSQKGVRGDDGGKRVKGRKRHLLVDTTGLILHVLVHEANIQEHAGGRQLLHPLPGRFPRLTLIWADSAYHKGGFVEWGKRDVGLGGRNRRASLERLARRLDAQGCRYRLGKNPPPWLPCVEMAMDRRENIRLAVHLAQARQGLRSAPFK